MSELILKKEYKVIFKNNFWFKRDFVVTPRILNVSDNPIDKKNDLNTLNKLKIYKIKANKINFVQFFYLKKQPYVDSFNLCFYQILDDSDQLLHIIELQDIAVVDKHRGKGIGKQLMIILDEIARENNVKFIIGELQRDRVGEPLDKRRNFFSKNGFKVWQDERSKLSGFVIRKDF